jgi:hypothetical protein
MILARCKTEGVLISKSQFKSLLLAFAFALLFALEQTAAAQTAPGRAKSPHGVFDILRDTVSESQPCWTNPAIDGVRWRGGWNRVQKKVDGPYDWSGPDAALALAQKHGKQIGISFVALMAPPEGLEAAGCKFVQMSYGRVPWINDPVFLAKWSDFIKAAGARYDGKVDYIAMGGLGRVIESAIARKPSDMATLDALGGLSGWESAVKTITEAHAAVFRETPFIFTALKPYRSPEGQATLRRVVNDLAPKYPKRFGVMNCSLNARSRTGYLPNELVRKWSSTNPCGLQFLTSTRGFKGHSMGGSLAEALDAGVRLGAHWIEIYTLDGDNPTNAKLLKDTAAKLPGAATKAEVH